MDENWEYWEFKKSDSDTTDNFGSGVYICDGFEIFVQAYEFTEADTALTESEKILYWLLEQKDILKKHVVDNYYNETILTYRLNIEKANSSEELKSVISLMGNACVEPYARKEDFIKYLQPNELVISYQQGFTVEFTAFGDTELVAALGGHGPTVEVDNNFSIIVGSESFSG